MKKKHILAVVLLLVSFLLTSCGEEKVKYSDKKDQLKLDMSYDEVKDILGEEGEMVSDLELGDKSHVTVYTWSNKKDSLSCLFMVSISGETSHLRKSDTEESNLIKIADTLKNLPQVQDGVLSIKPDDFVNVLNALLVGAGEFETMGDPSNNVHMYKMDKIGLALGVNTNEEIKNITVIGDPENEIFQGIGIVMTQYLVNYDEDVILEIAGRIGIFDGATSQGGYALYKKVVYGYKIEENDGSFFVNFEAGNL